MNRIHRELVDVGGVHLFVLDSKTSGLPILCLHGRWGGAETWIDFINHYSSRHRIIAPDQRGHGLSDKPVSLYSVEEMSKDILSLARTLKLGKYILVGHSMGGFIAAHIAAHSKNVAGLAVLEKNQAISANIANYHSWYDVLPRIRCPTMIARSSSHEAVSDEDFEIMKREIRHVYAYEISHPDHNIHLSGKEEFYGYFDDFLRRIA